MEEKIKNGASNAPFFCGKFTNKAESGNRFGFMILV